MTSNSSGEEQITNMIEKKAYDRNQTSELIRSRREQRVSLQESRTFRAQFERNDR